jgi:hypothetical protein
VKARQRDWVMVRLRRETHRELRKLEAIWSAAYSRGVKVPEPDEEGKIGLDRVITELLARDAAHRRRSNRKVLRATADTDGVKD